MTDNVEQTVRRNDEQAQKKDKIKYRIFFAVSGVCALYALVSFVIVFNLFLNGGVFQAALFIPALFSLALALAFFFLKNQMMVEYDYAIEDEHLLVAKILNLSSRKEMLDIPLTSCKRLEAYNKEKLIGLDAKRYSATLNEEGRYMLFFDKGSEKCVLVFEPNETLKKVLEKAL